MKTVSVKEHTRTSVDNTITNSITVGDIFENQWGYDQTNVDFYKVIAKTEKSVKIRKLKQNTMETGFMSGTTVPINEFENERILLKRPYLWNGEVYLNFEFGSCKKWDGRPARVSWYA